MESLDLTELIASSRNVDSCISKKKRKLDKLTTSSDAVKDNSNLVYPYEVEDDDHCETPLAAYSDIATFLKELAKELDKTTETLKIYDPYYCEGAVIENLNSLGFSDVYNKKEDFYAINASNSLPPFDVIVTNPPYSGDNVEKLLTICLKSNKPFFLLMPNYVYTKDYYDRVLQNRKNGVFYIVPKQGRYLYTTPKGRRQNKSGKYTAPFPTIWFCSLLRYQSSVIERCRKEEMNCVIALNSMSIPIERAKHSQRKKAKQIINNSTNATSKH